MQASDCTEEELKIYKEKYNLTLTTWNIAGVKDIRKVEIDGEAVALIEFSNSTFEENSVEIHNFEVFNKGKGIGTKIIKKLIKELEGEGIKLSLYSYSKESTSFWKKCNFEVYDDGTGTPILCYSE